MAEQEVIVEEAQLSDVKTLVDLLSQVSQETDFVVAETILSQEDMEIFLARHLESVNEICLVVRVGKKLAVQEKYWGYGLGSLLMEVALDWACHTPVIRRLELTVQARNSRAVHLYEKFDFKIEATKERGAKTKDGEFLDVYLMSRLID